MERINNLVEKIGDFEPDVQLLVCDSLGDDDNTAALSALTGVLKQDLVYLSGTVFIWL